MARERLAWGLAGALVGLACGLAAASLWDALADARDARRRLSALDRVLDSQARLARVYRREAWPS